MKKLSQIRDFIQRNGIKKACRTFFDVLQEKRLERIKQKRFPVIDRFPIENKIIFECQSDMDDNPRAIYEYMLEQGMNEQYQMIWIVKDVKFCRKYYRMKNVTFFSRFDKSIRNQLRLRRHLSTAKWLLFSHPYWYQKIKSEQIVLHTGHGTPLKNTTKNSIAVESTFDKMLATTEAMKPYYIKFWNCKDEQVFICGNPRNDLLFKGSKKRVLSKLFDCADDEKS